jgi:hypothetical protein
MLDSSLRWNDEKGGIMTYRNEGGKDGSKALLHAVTPAKAGVQERTRILSEKPGK